MHFDTRTLATLTMIAAPTLMFLAASAALVLVTGPSKAQDAGPRHIEIRGGETVEVPGPGGRMLKLKFTRVIADGRCATARCERAGAPVVEVQAIGATTPSFRLSPAAHLGAPSCRSWDASSPSANSPLRRASSPRAAAPCRWTPMC